jgi:hypothetical protein
VSIVLRVFVYVYCVLFVFSLYVFAKCGTLNVFQMFLQSSVFNKALACIRCMLEILLHLVCTSLASCHRVNQLVTPSTVSCQCYPKQPTPSKGSVHVCTYLNTKFLVGGILRPFNMFDTLRVSFVFSYFHYVCVFTINASLNMLQTILQSPVLISFFFATKIEVFSDIMICIFLP